MARGPSVPGSARCATRRKCRTRYHQCLSVSDVGRAVQVGAHGTERYSLASNQWVEKAQISNQRFGFGAAFADEGVYALGGHTYCQNSSSEACDNR